MKYHFIRFYKVKEDIICHNFLQNYKAVFFTNLLKIPIYSYYFTIWRNIQTKNFFRRSKIIIQLLFNLRYSIHSIVSIVSHFAVQYSHSALIFISVKWTHIFFYHNWYCNKKINSMWMEIVWSQQWIEEELGILFYQNWKDLYILCITGNFFIENRQFLHKMKLFGRFRLVQLLHSIQVNNKSIWV